LDHTPRFKYFTLHGAQHIHNLFTITDLLTECGLRLTKDQAFLLGCAICTHDLGMIVPLITLDISELFPGMPQPAEPTDLERQIRNAHHTLIGNYIDNNFGFLTSLGLTPGDCALIRDIGRCHRKIDLTTTEGFPRSIGALLRVVDELDVFASRAPQAILRANFHEMDATSCWHWFKHIIVEDWRLGHNVQVVPGAAPKITFKIAVHPSKATSIPYWLTQIYRPINRVLFDEAAARIVSETWGIQLEATRSQELSSAVPLGTEWGDLENKALSAGRKVILVVDDEVRKLVDLFLPIMMDYHVMFAPNTKDGLDKLAAAEIDLAIIDLQIGSGLQWSADDTSDFKMTGVKLCQEIHAKYPKTKFGILTGSRYNTNEAKGLPGLQFLLKKPVDPDELHKEVKRVLS